MTGTAEVAAPGGGDLLGDHTGEVGGGLALASILASAKWWLPALLRTLRNGRNGDGDEGKRPLGKDTAIALSEKADRARVYERLTALEVEVAKARAEREAMTRRADEQDEEGREVHRTVGDLAKDVAAVKTDVAVLKEQGKATGRDVAECLRLLRNGSSA